MANRIRFKVIEASSEDDNYKASELNHQEPISKGWRTHKESVFPEHIVIELDEETYITKIQILSHHYLIANHIDVYLGNLENRGMGAVHFIEFGSTDFNSPTHKVAELKSIYIHSIALLVKLVLHEPHPHEQNLHGQVSLLAINILGEPAADKTISSDPKERNIERSSVHYSPLDDLSYLMFQDAEVAYIIKQLDKMKMRAKDAHHGSLISKLEAIGKVLVAMELKKRNAIESKDAKVENLMTRKIENQRGKLHSMLDGLDLEDFPSEKGQSPPVKIVGCQPTFHSPKVSTFLRLDSFSTPRSPQGKLNSDERFHETPHLSDHMEKPLLPHKASQALKQDVNECITDSSNDVQIGTTDISAEELSEKDEKDASCIIEVFGMTTAREVFSRQWQCKLQGLRKILAFLEAPNTGDSPGIHASSNSSSNFDIKDIQTNIMKAVEQAVLRVLKEGIRSVFESCLAVYKTFILNYSASCNTLKLDLFLEHTLPQLLPRLAETRPKVRNMVSSLVVELSKSPDFKYKHLLMEESFKISRQNPTLLVVLRVTEMISSIYMGQGIKDSGLTLDSLVAYLADTMSNNYARKCTKELLLQIHSDLETSSNSRLSFRVKNLLKKFDSIDKRSKGDVTSRSESRLLNEVPKTASSELADQKPLVQNQVNKVPKDSKNFQKHSPSPVVSKPLKSLKENRPSPKTSSVITRNPQVSSLQKLQSRCPPHKQSLPSLKMSKGEPKNAIKKIGAPVHKASAKQQVARQMTTPTQEVEQFPHGGLQRRSFSLDRKKSRNDVERPIIDGREAEKDGIISRSCVFCGKEGVVCTDTELDKHFLTECPMLTRCDHCLQVLEVKSLSEHHLESCPHKNFFVECPKCRRAVLVTSFEEHSTSYSCKVVSEGHESCPICGDVIKKEEAEWRDHLMRPGACSQNQV